MVCVVPAKPGGPLEAGRDKEVPDSRSHQLLVIPELLSLGRPPCFPCLEAAVFFGPLPCSRITAWLEGLADSLPSHPRDCCFSGRKAKGSAFGAEDHVLSSAGFLQPPGYFFLKKIVARS